MAKVLVSIDNRLLRRIDRTAESVGLSRSAFLAEAAEADLARRHGPGQSETVRAALDSLDELFADAPSSDSTAAIRAARDAR